MVKLFRVGSLLVYVRLVAIDRYLAGHWFCTLLNYNVFPNE